MKQIPSHLLHAIGSAGACRQKVSRLLLLSPQACRSSLATLSRLDSLAGLNVEQVYALLPNHISICSATFWWQHPEEQNRNYRQDVILLLQESPSGKIDVLATAFEDGQTVHLDTSQGSRRVCADMRRAIVELYDIASAENPSAAVEIACAREREQHRIDVFETFLNRDDVVHAGLQHGKYSTCAVRQVLIEICDFLAVVRDPYAEVPLPYCFHYGRRAPVMSLRRTKGGGYALADMQRRSKARATSEKAAWRMLLRHLPGALDGEITGHQHMSLLDTIRRHPVSKGLLTLSEVCGDPQPALFETICAE